MEPVWTSKSAMQDLNVQGPDDPTAILSSQAFSIYWALHYIITLYILLYKHMYCVCHAQNRLETKNQYLEPRCLFSTCCLQSVWMLGYVCMCLGWQSKQTSSEVLWRTSFLLVLSTLNLTFKTEKHRKHQESRKFCWLLSYGCVWK